MKTGSFKHPKNKRVLIAAILATTILAAGSALLVYKKVNKNEEVSNVDNGTYQTIKYDPPTPEERSESEANKDRLAQESEKKYPDNQSTKTVVPVITNADRTTVTAYVPGIFEDGGNCTAEFKNQGTVLKKNSAGIANVSTTQCEPFTLEANFLYEGDWIVTVSYSSPTAYGVSSAKTLRVQ